MHRFDYFKNHTKKNKRQNVCEIIIIMSKIFKNIKIIKVEETESTNIYAGKLSGTVSEGSIVWADYQTLGRGNGSNVWESQRGMNLTFSVVLYPTFLKAVQQFYLSKAISLSIADFISLYVNNVRIKWPNDIYVENKKIAGILIENSIERDYINESIIGIGININQEIFLSGAPNPVSLCQLTGQKYDLKEMLDLFSKILEYRYSLIKDGEFALIDENYMDILYKNGINAMYKAGEIKFEGVIINVEKTGELIIKESSGKQHKFLHKEVEYIIEGL